MIFDKKKIFLIGYMGVGKTTIGTSLSKKIGIPFFDTDLLIENCYQKKIYNIFEEKGEEKFRKLEQKIIQEITQRKESIIVSTGGGTPCFFQNMKLLNVSGITVYLKITTELLIKRLVNIKYIRPLIKNKSSREIEYFVKKNLLERELFYKQASIICSIDGMEINDILNYLIQKIYV